jgi:hypothetical protein
MLCSGRKRGIQALATMRNQLPDVVVYDVVNAATPMPSFVSTLATEFAPELLLELDARSEVAAAVAPDAELVM